MGVTLNLGRCDNTHGTNERRSSGNCGWHSIGCYAGRMSKPPSDSPQSRPGPDPSLMDVAVQDRGPIVEIVFGLMRDEIQNERFELNREYARGLAARLADASKPR